MKNIKYKFTSLVSSQSMKDEIRRRFKMQLLDKRLNDLTIACLIKRRSDQWIRNSFRNLVGLYIYGFSKENSIYEKVILISTITILPLMFLVIFLVESFLQSNGTFLEDYYTKFQI